ncbi:MAG: hypothetical protein FWC16_11770 [Defluviitaleaceae bacterium]|nr:hypothetical protein [Defluviitaleaceae bacterium]
MNKKHWLFLTAALFLAASVFMLKTRNNNAPPWWAYLEYSPPTITIPELERVTMVYTGTELTHINYVIIMTTANASDYWIGRVGLGSFVHDALTTRLEFFDGVAWRIVPATQDAPPYPDMGFSPIAKGAIRENRFAIEYYFGLLKPGLYRIRIQCTIYAGINLHDTMSNDEREALRNLSRSLGPHGRTSLQNCAKILKGKQTKIYIRRCKNENTQHITGINNAGRFNKIWYDEKKFDES